MNFDTIVNMTEKLPDGWSKNLSVGEYSKLDDERKNYYGPIHAKYRVKKYRDYGEYGEYLGWAEMQVGIGDPIGYKYHGYMAAHVIESALSSNVLASRILSKKKW